MKNASKPVVLIVEDETLIRMLATDAFVEAGFEVLEAEHAAHAICVHERSAPVHVLFTDVNMPGELNGIDLAERLKAQSASLLVIITSALPILRSVDDIPATFVTKPYDAESVSRTAMALLAS
jgi:two-component system, response regulator PdtaR